MKLEAITAITGKAAVGEVFEIEDERTANALILSGEAKKSSGKTTAEETAPVDLAESTETMENAQLERLVGAPPRPDREEAEKRRVADEKVRVEREEMLKHETPVQKAKRENAEREAASKASKGGKK